MALPLILAGPIVRRVEPRLVSIWIALRDEADVEVHLWAGTQAITNEPATVVSGDAQVASSVTPTRRFGKNLHVAVATVALTAPTPALTPGTTYSYHIELRGQAFGASHMKAEGLLSEQAPDASTGSPGRAPLGYIPNRLPAFVTPAADIGGLRMAHASCRKPHGPVHDAMAWLDDHIGSVFDDTTERPQQLFLTGDQIYADDVASCLLPMLSEIAHEIVGDDERLEIGDDDELNATLTHFPAMRRQKLIWDLAKFTSSSGSNHLLSFGEYAAMYLAVWSPTVWRKLAETSAVIVPVPSGAASAVEPHLTDWEACAAAESTTFADMKAGGFERQRTAVQQFAATIPKVARVLANCSTYMIFDDHEITDDWNLNKRWLNRVYTRPLGRNIVRNGVMAYGVFQAWGNDPKNFEVAASDTDAQKNAKKNNTALLDETVKAFAGDGPYPHSSAQIGRLDEIVGAAGVHGKQAKFNYRVNGPRHTVLVLDTRTRRKFKGQGLISPDLLGGSLNAQVPSGPFTDGRELLIVVSPVPVLGPYVIETIGQPVAQIVQDVKIGFSSADDDDPCKAGLRLVGNEKYDAESWLADEVAFEKLFARLAPYGRAIILSGDVHYACSLTLDYWRKGKDTPARFAQLTSSPARNSFKAIVEALVRDSAVLQQFQTGPLPERLAWSGASPLTLADGASVGPARRARLVRSPSLIPARTWPPGTTIPDDKPPDWRWRVRLHRDERPGNELPVALRPEAAESELDPSAPFQGYRDVAKRHQRAAFTHYDHLRQMVFTPNVGLIDITSVDGVDHVVHTLLSRDAPASTTAAKNTRHLISLGPTSDPRPELVTDE